MKKKEYKKPELQVVFLHQQTQMLIGSPMSVKATGLDANEAFFLGDEPEHTSGDSDPKSGNAWEEAW